MRYRIEEYADRAIPADDGRWVEWKDAKALAWYTALFVVDNSKRTSQSEWCWYCPNYGPDGCAAEAAAKLLVRARLWLKHPTKNLYRPCEVATRS